MHLLDTNVLSEFMRPAPDSRVIAWMAALPEEDGFISTVTIAELRRGIALLDTGRRKRDLNAWLRDDVPARFDRRIIDVTAAVADRWGELMASARRGGNTLAPLDGFIAATAATHSLTLATRNTKDFEFLPLELKNPWNN